VASRNPEATVAHELGHFLDHQGFGEKGKYSSEYDPLFAAWREAVNKSLAIKRLQQIVKWKDTDKDTRERMAYYLQPS
jgi:hypothetical protein